MCLEGSGLSCEGSASEQASCPREGCPTTAGENYYSRSIVTTFIVSNSSSNSSSTSDLGKCCSMKLALAISFFKTAHFVQIHQSVQ